MSKSKPNKDETVGMRLSIDLDKDMSKRFTQLQHESDTENGAELFRDAMRVYSYFLLDVVGKGKRIFVGSPSSAEEVILFKKVGKDD